MILQSIAHPELLPTPHLGKIPISRQTSITAHIAAQENTSPSQADHAQNHLVAAFTF